MARALRTMAVIAATLLGAGSPAFARQVLPAEAPPIRERVGIGAMGALGVPGPMVAVRLSAPLAPRIGFDVDAGRARENDGAGWGIGAFARWLRAERRVDGASDYGILGVLLVDSTTRVDIRFLGERILQVDRRMRLIGQFGYGVDWQTPRGTRIGLEVASGGSQRAGPRVYARVFAIWGPAPKTIGSDRPSAPGRGEAGAERSVSVSDGARRTLAARTGGHSGRHP